MTINNIIGAIVSILLFALDSVLLVRMLRREWHMKGEHAITAFVDAHPEWKSMRKRLTARDGGGRTSIYLERMEVGVVWMEGSNIYAELLIGYTKLGE